MKEGMRNALLVRQPTSTRVSDSERRARVVCPSRAGESRLAKLMMTKSPKWTFGGRPARRCLLGHIHRLYILAHSFVVVVVMRLDVRA